jgi:hypothetical protein
METDSNPMILNALESPKSTLSGDI